KLASRRGARHVAEGGEDRETEGRGERGVSPALLLSLLFCRAYWSWRQARRPLAQGPGSSIVVKMPPLEPLLYLISVSPEDKMVGVGRMPCVDSTPLTATG